MRIKQFATVIAASAFALVMAGCSAGAPSAEKSSSENGGGDTAEALKVVATTTQVTDFVKQIGGEQVEVTGLLAAGASAHSFDPSPADLVALGEADVLFVNGADLEHFIDSAVEASGFDGEIVELASGVDLQYAEEVTAEAKAALDAGAATEGHDHEHEHADEHDHDHGTETEAHADEHDHDHANETVNPHLWTSPKLAKQMLKPVLDTLSEKDAAHAADYQANYDAYAAQLDELDAWISSEFGKVEAADKKFVSSHNALLYYLHDYGISYVGSVIPSFEDNAEPSAAEIDELVHRIQDNQVKAIFFESSVSDRLSQTVASEAGVTVVDEPLYADSLAVEGDAASYIGATIHNTKIILTAWGYTPGDTPEGLQ